MLGFSRFILIVLLLLTGCRGTLEIGLEAKDPVATATPTNGIVVTETSQAPTPTPSPAIPATHSPTPTFTPPPTATPAPTLTPTPKPSPTNTPLPPAPQIMAFGVSPAEADPGDMVVLGWQATGASATICPTARFVLFDEGDCRQVPLEGTTAFAIPPEAEGFQQVSFVLTVEGATSTDPAIAQASVALKCDETWFFSGEPQAGICPREPLHTYAAAQHFERGTMIWLEKPGRYYILEDTPLHEGATRNKVDIIQDPLEVVRDTSSEVGAPPGLYAPVSGFGLVWRGDVTGSPGYRERLGWALEPEFGYGAILQCDTAYPSGGRSWQTCYLLGPEGDTFVLHPLGGWDLVPDSGSGAKPPPTN